MTPRLSLAIISLLAAAACQQEKKAGPEVPKPALPQPVVDQSPVDLLTARKAFTTHIVPVKMQVEGPAEKPPAGVLDLIHYPSPAGSLAAYITPDPKDGKKHPAIVWAHGGFGGIGKAFWEKAPAANDQSAAAFRDAGLVVMAPSWRGENDNPGKFELFYGEVDDLLAAYDYMSKLPYVDPDRIYLGGHSTGGTLVLLAAVGSDKFRAAFSFGGASDMAAILADGKGYGNTPFDPKNAEESRLRSAIAFTSSIKRRTFYFEGDGSVYINDAARMRRQALFSKVTFSAFGIRGADHFNYLHAITRMVAAKIVGDTGPTCNITVSGEDIAKAMSAP